MFSCLPLLCFGVLPWVLGFAWFGILGVFYFFFFFHPTPSFFPYGFWVSFLVLEFGRSLMQESQQDSSFGCLWWFLEVRAAINGCPKLPFEGEWRKQWRHVGETPLLNASFLMGRRNKRSNLVTGGRRDKCNEFMTGSRLGVKSR